MPRKWGDGVPFGTWHCAFRVRGSSTKYLILRRIAEAMESSQLCSFKIRAWSSFGGLHTAFTELTQQ